MTSYDQTRPEGLTHREWVMQDTDYLLSLTAVDRARIVGIRAHAGQFRADRTTPYFEHPWRVKEIFTSRFKKVCDAKDLGELEDGLVACLLHDVVEDTDLGFEDLALLFSDRVIVLLKLLTNDTPDGTYLQYLMRLIEADDPVAIEIKICDIQANLEDTELHPNLGARKGLRTKGQLSRFILTRYAPLKVMADTMHHFWDLLPLTPEEKMAYVDAQVIPGMDKLFGPRRGRSLDERMGDELSGRL
jgi:(p)ppGpp synthase/HD superfamily hydrolase